MEVITYLHPFQGVDGATNLTVGTLKEALTNVGSTNATTSISSGDISEQPQGRVRHGAAHQADVGSSFALTN
ncbi:MAG: hypothetical protein KA817_04935 [Flavobacteriales bacterium]|nr:hypothetical protein [Flavobacteriales bacterium]